METIEAIIQRLDSAELHRKQDSDQILQVINLKYAAAHNAAEVLNSMIPLQVAVDHRTNSLIIRASEEQHLSAAKLLEVLDVPEKGPEQEQTQEAAGSQQRRLVLYWLASGPEFKTDRPIPRQLQPVIGELNQLGIENLQLVSRNLAAMDGNQVGFVNSVQAGDVAYELVVDGQLNAGGAFKETPRLSVTVRVNGSESNCHMQTTVTTPYDHFVVLGLTGLGELENAFVIQIQSVQAAGSNTATPSARRQ
jgi:hypothetical protein